ncbi:4-(cytidine 5'-diphospho)-2-C-methyl-D-erythritol kinase [Ornithinibacillus sp. 4-3]|uniref:4-diphosphocytidyl-2-C-methyl-D-erythritol kinase n=1 Tax=Ornithinibacillus sp. 4-3 TaxID=3231488 RepID=A0AB39HN86_9BACI
MFLYEKAPAKINLSLDILGKRQDGFHDVEMIMTTIDLSDRVELHLLEKDTIKVSLESRFVPNDERNLAYQAANLLKKEYQVSQGVFIKIDKSIPVSAGLAGGSSDAAAVLRGLNKLWNLNISTEKLMQLGLCIGSDVPFCVYNGTALVTGRGEQVIPLPAPPSCWVILAKPNIGVSSKTIFHQINVEELWHPNTQRMVDALSAGDFAEMCEAMGNALESITFYNYPEVARIKEKMKKSGAYNVLMSGSGPTIYGLVEHEGQAQRVYNSMRGFCDEVYMVRIIG